VIGSEEEARAFVAARCDPSAFVALERLVGRLQAENGRQNLVSAGSLESVWTRHVADSAQLLDHAPPVVSLWLDLGAGAGFPGLAIAIMRPEWRVHLVESRKLRVEWLVAALAEAKLANSVVIGSRIEAAETVPASVISARAFAPLPKLVGLARRFSTSDTTWLLPKGRSAAQEVEQLPLKMRAMFHVEPSVTDADSGIVVGRLTEGTGR